MIRRRDADNSGARSNRYRRSFIAETEEQELIREIQSLQLTSFQYYQFTGKRRTVSFGWQYEFGKSEITTAPDMPAFLLPFRTRAGPS
jgi:DNA oxidative demethylase